ncbi:MAG TPA: hypothetical protein VK894_03875, partial [Jiangellales bacterium]|nr:hypothetical protein [Jiangellales bacterium]
MAREGDQEQAPQPVRPVRPASRYAARPPSAAGRAAGWAALLTLGLWAAGLAVAYLLASDAVPPGQCQGLGFGCTPSARDSVALLAVFTAAPVVGVTAVAVPLAAWL